jgi:hypothetical protein
MRDLQKRERSNAGRLPVVRTIVRRLKPELLLGGKQPDVASMR